MAGNGARVGIAGSDGGGAIETAFTTAASSVPLPALTCAAAGGGGRVGIGANAGSAANVGQGVAEGRGRGVAVGDGDGTSLALAMALAASRRATRSHATKQLSTLIAITVARRPLPTLFGC